MPLRATALGLLAAVSLVGGCGRPAAHEHDRGTAIVGARTKHYAFGTGAAQSVAVSLGFDVLDVAGSRRHPEATKRIVDALPPGTQALVWVGNLDNTDCTPAYSTAAYEALVDAMASDPRVFGYYLSDEPHPARCPSAAADIRARADYLHDRARSQIAFIVVQDGYGECGARIGCEFEALAPARTHVDLVGLDPYPCHYAHVDAAPCDDRLIERRVAAATANGIDTSRIVPIFQTFGQEGRVGGSVYYRTPTPAELERILDVWEKLLPDPPLDAAYSFGTQCSATCPAPQALLNHPELHSPIEAHNG